MKASLLSLPLIFTSLLIGGCATLEKGEPQEVVIVSVPSEASVYINGEAAGITPMTVSLPRKLSHEVRLEKYGYNTAVKYFTPVPNEKSENFIRFGLADDLGHYVDLTPGTLEAEMTSELVPNSVGADPFARMSEQALEADRRFEAGEISAEEHKYIIEQILEFFEKQS